MWRYFLRTVARYAFLCDTLRIPLAIADGVDRLRQQELVFGIDKLETYAEFEQGYSKPSANYSNFNAAKHAGKQVVGYGAPGKGNTLLNYCGIRTDFLLITPSTEAHTNKVVLRPEPISLFCTRIKFSKHARIMC